MMMRGAGESGDLSAQSTTMRSLESLGRRATIQPSVDRNGITTRCKGLAGIVVRDGQTMSREPLIFAVPSYS
jgi:hypothetical protein